MRVHVLQHVAFEGLGSIHSWVQSRNATVSVTPFHESASLPEQSTFDVLIALGGPMSVNDESEFPWLVEEKRFVRETMSLGKPVLGICLGAQLIASALGARVYPGSQKEIGWFPVDSMQNTDGFRFPNKANVFHWHGETFDLPVGAIHLAKSDACVHQAFQIGERVIGLQFHLETTPESVDSLIANCHHELVVAPYIQAEHDLRSAPESNYTEINNLMASVLSYITRSEILV